ncbi:MAG: hypothetical protein ABJF23_02920 [Bryobacteraceae bacterium]
MTQIEVENNTPYRRRVFLHPSGLSLQEPVPLLLTAWKHFDLGPGESIGTALGGLRIGARIAQGSMRDHRTVVADAQFGEKWTVGMTNGIPALSSGAGAPPNGIQVQNGLDGSEAAVILVTLYWDYAPWFSFEVSPGYQTVYSFTNQLFAYASTPIAGGGSALVMEPAAGKFSLPGGAVRLKLTPTADGTTIQWAMEPRP